VEPLFSLSSLQAAVPPRGRDRPSAPSLATVLALIEPYVPRALVPEKVLADIMRAAAGLFPVTGTGFECRLNAESEEVDLGLRIAVQDGSSALLAGTHPALELPTAIAADPLWQRVSRICRIWGSDSLALSPFLDRLCVEVDHAETVGRTPRPSLLFFDLLTAAKKRDPAAVIDTLLDLFLPLAQDRTIPVAQQAQLRRVCEVGRNFGSLCHAGTALARPGGDVRLVFQVPRPSVAAYLSAVGFAGRAEAAGAIVDRVASGIDNVMVQVDVTHGVGEKFGIDLMGYPVQGMKGILKGLLQNGLCDITKALALADWPHYSSGGEAVLDILNGNGGEIAVIRHIHHIKLAFAPGKPATAKAYLYAACIAPNG
jgi:hypothetical protein